MCYLGRFWRSACDLLLIISIVVSRDHINFLKILDCRRLCGASFLPRSMIRREHQLLTQEAWALGSFPRGCSLSRLPFVLILVLVLDPPIRNHARPTPRPTILRSRSCRLYDEHGLILETSTHLEDIVMSDYFQIDDRCVVQPGRGDAGTVRVDIEVEVSAAAPACRSCLAPGCAGWFTA